MSWMKSVFSSSVSEVGYDPDTGELLVRWNNGRTSAYAGVSEDEANSLAEGKIASVGQYLNSEIKPNYSHRYR
jgi:hypothetical protein